jgi:hypothetical protein
MLRVAPQEAIRRLRRAAVTLEEVVLGRMGGRLKEN